MPKRDGRGGTRGGGGGRGQWVPAAGDQDARDPPGWENCAARGFYFRSGPFVRPGGGFFGEGGGSLRGATWVGYFGRPVLKKNE